MIQVEWHATVIPVTNLAVHRSRRQAAQQLVDAFEDGRRYQAKPAIARGSA